MRKAQPDHEAGDPGTRVRVGVKCTESHGGSGTGTLPEGKRILPTPIYISHAWQMAFPGDRGKGCIKRTALSSGLQHLDPGQV
jgi:hypothetical protein